MDDLISREKAIHAFHICLPGIPLKRLNEIFSAVPSAQPERKMGKWKTYGHDFFGDNEYRCTACGETANIKTDFCPNCGADMRGEKNEQR